MCYMSSFVSYSCVFTVLREFEVAKCAVSTQYVSPEHLTKQELPAHPFNSE